MKKKYIILIILSLIIFFEPQMFKEEAFAFAYNFDYIYKILKLLSAVFIIYIYLKHLKKISWFVSLIVIIQLITFISTLVNHGDIIRFMGPAITTFTMAMIAELIIKKNEVLSVLKPINKYFLICYIINIMSIILVDFTSFNDIANNVYFLGIDNRFIFTFLPWVVSEGIVSYIEKGHFSKRFYFILILVEGVLLYRFSLAAMLVMLLFLLVGVKKINFQKYNNITFFGMILANVSLLLFNVTKYFSNILSFFNRDITLSGRTFLWNGTIKSIKSNLSLGTGMKSLANDKLFFFRTSSPYYLDWCKVSHPHNSLLAITYRGGIVCVLIYLFLIYICLKNLKQNHKNQISKLLYISMVVIMITSLFDTMDFAGLYFIFAFCWFIPFLNKEVDVND